MKIASKIIIFCLLGYHSIAQFSQVEIETDSSVIELTKNSVYRIWEESYKNKDSVFYSVSFINDTTQINTQGWKNKKGDYFGVWKEFNEEGKIMYTRDYDKISCDINTSLYPYHGILTKMKLIADSLIVSTYSQEFYEKHVQFNFNCTAYNGKWKKYSWADEKQWILDYSGTWTEPMKSKPNSFLFRYDVKLNESDVYKDMIGIKLDSTGNFIPSHDRANNYGFEKTISQKRNFSIDKEYAIEIASQHGLTNTKDEISEFLTWEKFNSAEFYDGQFRYYITELYDQIEYKEGNDRQGIIFKFNVYVFNPWTNEFIEKKKMKSRKEWGKDSGHTTGLRPDNE
jgi:hypothetical protein